MAGSAKRVVGTLLFLIALVSVLAFYFVVFARANQVSGVPGTDSTGALAVGVSVLLGLVLIVLIILLVVRSRVRAARDEPEEAEAETPYFLPPEEAMEMEPAFEDVGDDMVAYDVWTLPVARRAWGGEEEPLTFSFYFPLNAEGGVYVNDYIRLDDNGARLKLRTLLAGPSDVGSATFVVPERQAADDWEEPSEEWQDEPEALAEAPLVAPPARKAAGTGAEFMSELERRFEEEKGATRTTSYTRAYTSRTASATHTVPAESAYYDYRGDDHPVEDVEGIGAVYAAKLKAQGIETTGRLCYENPAKLSTAIDVPMKTIETWQSMAQLMKVSGIGPQYAEALARAGIEGIDELKRRSPSRLADQVNDYLDSLEVNVIGTKITERRIAGWQAAAKSMRRVRQIPADK